MAAIAFAGTLFTIAPAWSYALQWVRSGGDGHGVAAGTPMVSGSLAGVEMRLLVRKLPLFALLWYCMQALVALSFVTQVRRARARSLSLSV